MPTLAVLQVEHTPWAQPCSRSEWFLLSAVLKKALMLHPNLLFFWGGGGVRGGMISINITSSNVIKAKKGQQSCMIIHRMTPIISPPLIYAAPDSGARRGAVSQRDRNLCDQHENNIRLTRPSLICKSQWKEKRNGFQITRPPRWFPGLRQCTLLSIRRHLLPPSSTPPRVLFLLHFCLMVNSQIWRPPRAHLPMLMYLFRAAWVHICLFFST